MRLCKSFLLLTGFVRRTLRGNKKIVFNPHYSGFIHEEFVAFVLGRQMCIENEAFCARKRLPSGPVAVHTCSNVFQCPPVSKRTFFSQRPKKNKAYLAGA